MKYSFNQFKKLLFESILDEDKSRLIDKLVLPDMDDEEEKQKFKEQLKDYFKKYSAFEKYIDWNKWKILTKSDFDEVLNMADQSNKAQKSKERQSTGIDPKSFFNDIDGRKFKIIDDSDPDWLFVAPLNWNAAYFCDSKECGGASAKWCIGYEKTDYHWRNYIKDGSKFIMAFSKHFDTMPEKELFTKLKYMIQLDYYHIIIWDQKDKKISNNNSINRDENYIGKLFDSIDISEYHVKKSPIPYRKFKSTDEIVNGYVNFFNKDRIKRGVYQVPDGATKLDFISFDGDNGTYTTHIERRIQKIIIPASVVDISELCFWRFPSLKEVIFEPRNTPIKIHNEAFTGSMYLEKINFPSTTIFGKNVINFSPHLKEVTVPKKYFKNKDLLQQILGNINYNQVEIIPV